MRRSGTYKILKAECAAQTPAQTRRECLVLPRPLGVHEFVSVRERIAHGDVDTPMELGRAVSRGTCRLACSLDQPVPSTGN